MTPFICPVCRLPLSKDGQSLKCEKRHCFDIAKEGYINLAVGKTDSGDDPDMCRARHEFLSSDYYLPLAEAIADELSKNGASSVCDAGCGEGYYSRVIKNKIHDIEIVALDLAKTSVRLGAKEERGKSNPITYAVVGIFDMPLPDNSFDSVISVFAPIPESEASRILRGSGTLIVVHPGKNHLMGLKRAVYDHPYENEEKQFSLVGFDHCCDKRVSYSATVKKEHIFSLFLMTPYFYKTSKTDRDKLRDLNSLETEIDFIISIYKKI